VHPHPASDLDSYQTACSSLVGGLSGDLEGDVVWGGVLDLEGGGGGVVEVLRQKLKECELGPAQKM